MSSASRLKLPNVLCEVDTLQGTGPGGRKDVQQNNYMKMNPTVLNINK